MTNEDILAAIKASEQLRGKADIGSDAEIAESLSATLPSVPRLGTFIGERGIFTLLGIEAAETFLQTVEGIALSNSPLAAPFKRVDRWIKDSIGLDVGSVLVQQTLLSMTVANGGPFANAAVAALIAHGSQPQLVTVDEIAAALLPYRSGGIVAPINWNNV